MSQACLRKLNRERESDTKTKLNTAYKNLLRIGINLNSRSNMASLIHAAEKCLKELLVIKNVLILVIDHDLEMFVKLNQDMLVPSDNEDNKTVHSH